MVAINTLCMLWSTGAVKMLYLIKGALEAAYFTARVVLWGVINASELLVWGAFSISNHLLYIVSEVAPAVFSLLKQVTSSIVYAAEELYEVR